ncbi:MAG: hypothetical protein ACP5JL_02750, partial [bacterium]
LGYISRVIFPNDEALFKGIYLAVMEVTKKWTGKIKDWHLILAELAVYFEDRLGGSFRNETLENLL